MGRCAALPIQPNNLAFTNGAGGTRTHDLRFRKPLKIQVPDWVSQLLQGFCVKAAIARKHLQARDYAKVSTRTHSQ